MRSLEALAAWQAAIPGPEGLWYALTEAGSGLLYFLLALYLALAGGRPALGFALAAGWGAVRLLKAAFDLPRPFAFAPELAYPPALAGATDPSFPSGHATLAALVGLYLARGGPAWGYLLGALWALFVGLSRVELGVHFPGDVLAGWALGALLAFLLPRRTPALWLWTPALALGLAFPHLGGPMGTAAGFLFLRKPLGPWRALAGVALLLLLLALLPREGPGAALVALFALTASGAVVGWGRWKPSPTSTT